MSPRAARVPSAADAAVPAPSPGGDWRTYEPLVLPRILDAALQSFREHGYHGTSTRELAQRSGLSVPGIYHHYSSKQDILMELLMVIIEEMLDHSRRALDWSAPDPRSQFDALVESMLRFHMYRRDGATLSTSELRSLEPANRVQYVSKRDVQQRMLDRVIFSGIESGDFTTSFPAEASRAIASFCVGVAGWYRPDGELPVEALLERYLTIARSIVGISGR